MVLKHDFKFNMTRTPTKLIEAEQYGWSGQTMSYCIDDLLKSTVNIYP